MSHNERRRDECEDEEPDPIERMFVVLKRHIDAQFIALADYIGKRFDRLERFQMTTQAEIDALTQTVNDAATALGAAVAELTADDSALVAEIQRLEGNGVDVSGLRTAVGNVASTVTNVSDAVKAISSLVPAPTTGDTGNPPSGTTDSGNPPSTSGDTGTTGASTDTGSPESSGVATDGGTTTASGTDAVSGGTPAGQ